MLLFLACAPQAGAALPNGGATVPKRSFAKLEGVGSDRAYRAANSRWGNIGVVLGLCKGYMGMMEKNMEAAIKGLGFRVLIQNR